MTTAESQSSSTTSETFQPENPAPGPLWKRLIRWIVVAVVWILWFYCCAGLIGGGLALLLNNHRWWGMLCTAIGLPLFIAGLNRIQSFKEIVADWMRAFWQSPSTLLLSYGKSLLEVLGWGLGAVLLLGGITWAFDSIDDHGYVMHNRVTPVWIQGDWMLNEFRICEMRTKTIPADRKDLDSLRKLPRLFCAEDSSGLFDFQRESAGSSLLDLTAPASGEMYFIGVTADPLDRDFHALPVRYFGRINRTDKYVISWRCQRINGFFGSASLECKALN